MKKFKSIQKENIKMNFMVGLNSFLSFFFLIASIDSTSLTNIVFISRLYPFLVMLNHTLTKPENISNHQLVSFIIYFFSFLIIFFPALYQDTGFGVVYALLSIIFKFSSLTYLSNAKGLNVDLLMLNIGFFNAFFGGLIVVTTFDEIEHVGKFMWILIILNALCTYFMKIFLNKVLKGNGGEQKLMFLSVIALIFIIPFDFYVFEQSFYYNDLVLIFSFTEIYFFYKTVKKVIKTNTNYS
jgi:hypothetical protein